MGLDDCDTGLRYHTVNGSIYVLQLWFLILDSGVCRGRSPARLNGLRLHHITLSKEIEAEPQSLVNRC